MTALVASMSGVAFAQVRDNSIRSGDIRDGNVRAADIATNAVGRAEIRRDAVATSELAPNAVIGENVGENQLGGREILESTLGKIPTAGNADHADRADIATRSFAADNANALGGRPAAGFITTKTMVPLFERLSFGEKREIVTNGPIGLEADCRENIGAQGQDELRLLGVTRQNGSFMQGDTPHSGPGVGSDFLNTDTPEDNRTMGGIVTTQAGEGQPAAEDDIDTGFVAGPNGEYIGIDETTMYAINVGNSDCLLVGSAVVLSP